MSPHVKEAIERQKTVNQVRTNNSVINQLQSGEATDSGQEDPRQARQVKKTKRGKAILFKLNP